MQEGEGALRPGGEEEDAGQIKENPAAETAKETAAEKPAAAETEQKTAEKSREKPAAALETKEEKADNGKRLPPKQEL